MLSKPGLFKVIADNFSTFPTLKQKVSEISAETWELFQERKIFNDQASSFTIPIYNERDIENIVFKNYIKNVEIETLLTEELNEIDSIIKHTYINTTLRRSMLVLLPGKCSVKQHVDTGYHLFNTHRLHIPILTNDQVVFTVNQTVVPMKEGAIIEINNNVWHKVENKSSEKRIHLILDYGLVNDPYYTD